MSSQHTYMETDGCNQRCCRLTFGLNDGKDLEMLSKNLSYEGNYHRRIYYAKIVYDRIRERKLALAGWPVYSRASNNSFDYSLGFGRSSSDSLPDLLTIAPPCETGDDELKTIDFRKFRRCSSSEHCDFSSFDHAKGIDIKPFLGGSESSTSLPRCSPGGSIDGESLSVEGESTDIDENDLLVMVQRKSHRRSSSLKSRDSKSGDPARKKSVRFADVFGLDLHSVKHIMNKDDPPILPKAALQDLKHGIEEARQTEGTRYMCASFTQPFLASDFLERVKTRKVALETCLVDDRNRTVTGTVRVSNICYNKSVTVRYSLNKWVTFSDVAANYILNSNDGTTDRFSFSIMIPLLMTVGSRLEFALKFSAVDLEQSYWDNNFSDNYQVICYAKAIPTHGMDSTWMHFL